MDAKAENVHSDDIVIIVENEAESLPAEEERFKQQGTIGLMDTCPVCKLSFHNREPKLLPCLHSLCKKCLPPAYGEPKRDIQGLPVNNNPLSSVQCPVCKQECWEIDVLDNFFVKDSAEAPSSTMEKSSQVCMSCEDNTEATGYCVECVEFLCVTCIEAHQRVKFTRDHTIRQKQDMSPESLDISTQRPVFCDIHKQEPLKLFCETCDRLTCRDCQLLRHKDHNYQFLEDAYRNHKQYLEHMTQQLQEKRKTIEEVSNYITNGLQQVEENRKVVTNEIKKSICNLIMEINRKGKILINQLEALTKDHELALKKHQADTGALSRHLDHVISFTKWATASHSGTALLYCKRLILYQIHYLMRASCNPALIPQSSVRFQCRSGFWATNVDLGALVVERGTARPPIANPSTGPRMEAPPGGPSSQQRQTTLAQLQMQVDKMSQQPPRQSAPNQWAWYQNVRLPGPLGPPPSARPIPGGSSPSQAGASPSLLPQLGRRYGGNHQATRSPTSTMLNSNSFPAPQSISRYPQPLHAGGMTQASLQQRQAESNFLKRSEPGASLPSVTISVPKPSVSTAQASATANGNTVQGRHNPPMIKPLSSDKQTGTVLWKPAPESSPAVKRRRRLSPGPIIVIKDEPEDEDEVSFVQSSGGSSLPDSSTAAKSKPRPQQKTCPTVKITLPNSNKLPEKPTPEMKKSEKRAEPEDDPNEDWCAVCQNGGELLCCDKCPKVFHLSCHIPTLNESPSGEWYCSFCRDLEAPEMQYVCDRKDDLGTEQFPVVDRTKCERILLRLFCNDISTDFQQPASPVESKRYKDLIKTPMDLSIVKKRLEAKSTDSECYSTPEDFVSDIRLIFSNCAKYYKATSEVGSAGLYLEDYFEEQLKLVYPERVFPGGREEGMIPPLEDEIEEEEADLTEKTVTTDNKPESPTEQDAPEGDLAAEKEDKTIKTDKTEDASNPTDENMLEKKFTPSDASTVEQTQQETELKDNQRSPEVKNDESDQSLPIAQPEAKSPPLTENTAQSETGESSDVNTTKEEEEEEEKS